MSTFSRWRFPLGRVFATCGVLALFPAPSQYLADCLDRHRSGDWGCVSKEDAATNEEAVREGFRILSAYPINPVKPSKGFGANTLWIITEADRSVTTLLLPEDY